MYSGQEIVSQEECKIILGEFYEGVDCFDANTNLIKFKLLDWATASYDVNTMTLKTRNFSCKPIILDGAPTVSFMAKIPDGVTGLEVRMHTDNYERIRIMPIVYLRRCDSYNWSYRYGHKYFAQIRKFCNTGTSTVIKTFSKINDMTGNTISLVDPRSPFEEPLIISLWSDTAPNGTQISFHASYHTEDVEVEEYVYSADGSSYHKETVFKEELTITLHNDYIVAPYVRFEGLYKFEAKLYPCEYDDYIDGTVTFCNEFLPVARTKMTVVSGEASNVHITSEKITFGNNEITLQPKLELLSGEGTETVYFALAEKVEYLKPYQTEFDIYPCPGQVPSFKYFNIFAHMYMYPENDDLQTNWYMDVTVAGSFSYIRDQYVIIDTSGETEKRHTFWTNEETPKPIKLSPYTIQHPDDDKIILTKIPVNWCSANHYIDGVLVNEVPNHSYPITSDSRIVWDKVQCKKLFNCTTVNVALPDCATCEQSGEGVNQQVTFSEIDSICDCDGAKTNDYASACDQGTNSLDLGKYPSLNNLQPVIKESFVYFAGTIMYLKVEAPLFDYFVPIGDLSWGITGAAVIDEATGSSHSVSFSAYIALKFLDIPFEYFSNVGLVKPSYWYDIWAGITPKPSSIMPAEGSFDLKISAEHLHLPNVWLHNYDWSQVCDWINASRTYVGNFPETFYITDPKKLDTFSCKAEERIHTTTSNWYLRHGPSTDLGCWGSLQDGYEQFAQDISLLASPTAEAYAYANNKYSQGS